MIINLLLKYLMDEQSWKQDILSLMKEKRALMRGNEEHWWVSSVEGSLYTLGSKNSGINHHPSSKSKESLLFELRFFVGKLIRKGTGTFHILEAFLKHNYSVPSPFYAHAQFILQVCFSLSIYFGIKLWTWSIKILTASGGTNKNCR